MSRDAGRLAWLLTLAMAFAMGFAMACATADPGLPYRQEGEAALAEGAAERAVAAYQLALTVAPNDPRALRGLLDAQVAYGDGEAALETLAWLELVSSEPANPCPALALATHSRIGRGAYEAADATARTSVDAGCQSARALLSGVLAERAEVAGNEGEYSQAIQWYRDALDLDPSQTRLFLAASELLIAEERVAESIRLLASGLEWHPDDRDLRDMMVRALSIAP